MNVQFKTENRKRVSKGNRGAYFRKGQVSRCTKLCLSNRWFNTKQGQQVNLNEEVNETAVQNLVNRLVERGFEMVARK